MPPPSSSKPPLTGLQHHREGVAGQQRVRISRKDDRALSIEFIDGAWPPDAGNRPLGDGEPDPRGIDIVGKQDTSIVLKGILRVCKEMGAHCQPAD
jgi:hypothetical protein